MNIHVSVFCRIYIFLQTTLNNIDCFSLSDDDPYLDIIYAFGFGAVLSQDNIRKGSIGVSLTKIGNNPNIPSIMPTLSPTNIPTHHPTHYPTFYPTKYPTYYPTIIPSNMPSFSPTQVVCNGLSINIIIHNITNGLLSDIMESHLQIISAMINVPIDSISIRFRLNYIDIYNSLYCDFNPNPSIIKNELQNYVSGSNPQISKIEISSIIDMNDETHCFSIVDALSDISIIQQFISVYKQRMMFSTYQEYLEMCLVQFSQKNDFYSS